MTVFIEDARQISENDKAELPWEKQKAVSGKIELWIQVACPEGACSLDKNKITLPAGGVVPK